MLYLWGEQKIQFLHCSLPPGYPLRHPLKHVFYRRSNFTVKHVSIYKAHACIDTHENSMYSHKLVLCSAERAYTQLTQTEAVHSENIRCNRVGEEVAKWKQKFVLCLKFWVWRLLSLAGSHTLTHTQTSVPNSQSVLTLSQSNTTVWWGTFVLEDLRTLAPVLSFFGLPVTAPVDVGVFSCWIICPFLEPQWLVALDVLP